MRYIIENDFIKAEISDLGATLTRFIIKKNNKDIVLGYENDDDYLKHAANFFGATVGRNANRIGNACFILNDKKYELSKNNHMNNLHGGGINGFSYKIWNVKEINSDKIVLHYFSKDLEEGFPGNLDIDVTYQLKDNNLIFSFVGESDQDTLFNITNHSYFNLGDVDILNHYLFVNSDKYSPTDEYDLTLDEVLDVSNSKYDFKEYRLLKDNLKKSDKGIDNNYVFENLDDKLMCKLKYEDIELKLYSDLPDMHIYTGDHLNNDLGKYNNIYNRFAGIALECQYYPNGINYDNYIKPILKKNERMSHYIRYEIN